jgi:DNA repair ATPase RecN
LANLESQVTNRVAKPFENWNQARETGTDRYRALMDLKKRVEADWPPIECQTREVEQLLQAARREENRLQGSGRTVSDVRSALGRVTGYYRELTSEAQEVERQTQGDQQKLRDLVSRIEHWQRSLQSYGRSHSRDDYVEDGVDRRLSEIEKEIRDLQRRWRGAPPSYREASRELESLWHRSRRDIDTRDGRSVQARDVDEAR